jgi:hypothetical protein
LTTRPISTPKQCAGGSRGNYTSSNGLRHRPIALKRNGALGRTGSGIPSANRKQMADENAFSERRRRIRIETVVTKIEACAQRCGKPIMGRTASRPRPPRGPIRCGGDGLNSAPIFRYLRRGAPPGRLVTREPILVEYAPARASFRRCRLPRHPSTRAQAKSAGGFLSTRVRSRLSAPGAVSILNWLCRTVGRPQKRIADPKAIRAATEHGRRSRN